MVAGQKPISVVIKGEYTDKDVKKAIADLRSLQSEAPAAASQFSGLGGTIAKLGGVLAATFTVSKVVDFFQESVKAAMEDEKSLVALAKAMDNVGLAQKNAAAEDLIKSMSLQFGIADDQLRPAFQRLVTATKNVEQSQRLLQTAVNISAAGYADLESAAKALSAASMGNFTALQRLKLPIDANTIAAKDFEGALSQLNDVVGGQAAAAAETYQGKLNRITVAAGEAKETIGYALLKAFDDLGSTMGGPDGVVRNITDAGNAMAGLITFTSRAIQPLTQFASSLNLINGSTSGFDALLNSFVRFGQYIPGAGSLLNLLAIAIKKGEEWSNDAANAQRNMTSATVQAAQAAASAVPSLNDMTDGLAEVSAAAYEAAGSYMAFFESVVNKQRVQRDLANTSGTVSSAILEGVTKGADLTEAKLKEIRDKIAKAAGSGSGSKGSAGKQAQEFVLLDAAMRRTLQTVNRTAMGYDDLTRSLGASEIAQFSRKMLAAGEITGDTKTEFEGLVSTIKGRLDKALSDANDKLKEQQALWKGVYDTIAGGVMQGNGVADAAQQQADAAQALAEAQKAYDDAVAGGNSDEIAKTGSELEKAKGKQRTFLSFLQDGVDAAQSFSGQLKQITEVAGNTQEAMSLVSQIAQLGAKTGSRVAAELLAGGAAAIQNAVQMVGAVQAAANAAGVVAADTFYGAGVASAQAYVDALTTTVQPLLQGLLNSIAAQIAAALKQPVNANLGGGAPTSAPAAAAAVAAARPLGAYTPVSPGAGPNIPSGEGRIYAELRAMSRRAGGGPVMSGTPYLVGEVGPEVFVPHTSGTIIPNGGLGSTYNITVQAGIGDPRAIGQQVVEAITRFERANGPVYAKA